MLLSIIVPVYNVKKYLIKCLDSIDKQTFKDYEVIVVDDGSTDGSCELIDGYCKGKDRFHAYHKENGGLMSAWKYGLNKSKGEYIGFVDSDDYIDVSMYQKLTNVLQNNDIDIVLCNHYYVEEKSLKKTLHNNPIQPGVYKENELFKIRNKMLPLFGKDYISPSRVTKIIKRDLILNCLKYTDNRVSSGEDVCSIVPCMFCCKSFAYVDEPLYYYVQRKSSISHVFNENIFDTYCLIIDSLKFAAKECELSEMLDLELNGLYNVYGLTWLNYVIESDLKYQDKNRQYARMIAYKEYVKAAKEIHLFQGSIALIYKISVNIKSFGFFVLGTKLHRFLYRFMEEIK